VQFPPFDDFVAQRPPLHQSADEQSPSVAQLVLHAPAVHAYGAQFVVVFEPHAPAPLQTPALVSVLPEQLAESHGVVPVGSAHDVRLVPLQLPAPQVVPSFAHADLPPTGAPVIGWQVPRNPG
jgi:hypothetical protein